MNHQRSKVRHRPTPRKRCRKDGRETVGEILPRHAGEIALVAVGCLCIAAPVAVGVADWLTAAVTAYGGSMAALGAWGVTRR